MTVEQFLALPEEETFHKELIGGEIVEMGNARAKHEIAKANANQILCEFVLQAPEYVVLPESFYGLSAVDGCIPDVSLVRREDLDRVDQTRQFHMAPWIAVEVVSSETAARLQAKVEAFLKNGTKAVWVIYADEKVLLVHHPDGQTRRLRIGDALEDPGILPGFSAPVSRFFRSL